MVQLGDDPKEFAFPVFAQLHGHVSLLLINYGGSEVYVKVYLKNPLLEDTVHISTLHLIQNEEATLKFNAFGKLGRSEGAQYSISANIIDMMGTKRALFFVP